MPDATHATCHTKTCSTAQPTIIVPSTRCLQRVPTNTMALSGRRDHTGQMMRCKGTRGERARGTGALCRSGQGQGGRGPFECRVVPDSQHRLPNVPTRGQQQQQRHVQVVHMTQRLACQAPHHDSDSETHQKTPAVWGCYRAFGRKVEGRRGNGSRPSSVSARSRRGAATTTATKRRAAAPCSPAAQPVTPSR